MILMDVIFPESSPGISRDSECHPKERGAVPHVWLFRAKYLRQTILLSRYDSPEARGVFQRRCLNLHGKLRLESSGFPGILDRMKFGLEQRFERFDLEGPQGVEAEIASKEVDQRFEWFKNKVCGSLEPDRTC